MDRPSTACAVMLVTLAVVLLAVGATNSGVPATPVAQRPQRPTSIQRSAVNCLASACRQQADCKLNAEPSSYANSCGRDRTTGVCYGPAAVAPSEFVSSDLGLVRSLPEGQLHIDETIELMQSFLPELLRDASLSDSTANQWPAFYNELAAANYAAAEHRAGAGLRPQPALSVNSLAAFVRSQPWQHNFRTAAIALGVRSQRLVAMTRTANASVERPIDAASLASTASPLDWAEYENTVEKIINPQPLELHAVPPPAFRPAPSPARMQRITLRARLFNRR